MGGTSIVFALHLDCENRRPATCSFGLDSQDAYPCESRALMNGRERVLQAFESCA